MKCFYVLLIINVLLSGIFIKESKQYSDGEIVTQVAEEESFQDSMIGIRIDTAYENSSIAWYVAEYVASGVMILLVGIFMTVLACSERDSGFLKNLSACGCKRWQIIVARLVPGIICSILFPLIQFTALSLTNLIYGCPLSFGDIQEMIPLLGIQILLHTAFSALVLLIVEIFRNIIASIIICIISVKEMCINKGKCVEDRTNDRSPAWYHNRTDNVLDHFNSEAFFYWRQILDICRQLSFHKENKSNLEIRVHLRSKEVLKLQQEINDIFKKYQELDKQYRDSESNMRELITNISHDIRTPLTSISGYFQMLCSTEDIEKREQYTKIIQNRIASMSMLLEQFFTYVKIQNDGIPLNFTRCD